MRTDNKLRSLFDRRFAVILWLDRLPIPRINAQNYRGDGWFDLQFQAIQIGQNRKGSKIQGDG